MIKIKSLMCSAVATLMILTSASCAVSAMTISEPVKLSKDKKEISAKNGMIETDQFVINVHCGLEGNFRSGALPVNLNISNLGEDFEGTLRIIVPGNNDYGNPSVAYEKDVLLTGQEESQVSMNIRNDSQISYLFLQLEDSKGKLLVDKRIKMSGKNTENALVGVLSEDYTALNYMDKILVDLGSYSGNIEEVELKADLIPTEASGLEALSYMVINSFDTSNLSTDQITAIEKWVGQGGVLIIGTGSDYKQTLSGFGKDFISGNVAGTAEGKLEIDSKSYDYYLLNGSYSTNPIPNTELSFTQEDGILDITVDDAEVLEAVVSEDKLIWDKKYKEGHIVLTAFNLGMSPVTDWESNVLLANLLFKKSAHGFSQTRIYNINYGNNGYSYNMRSGLLCLRDDQSPNTLAVIIVFLIFICGIPISYLILKSMDKRGFIWFIIPAASVLMAGAILLLNSNIRINHPETTSVTYFYDDYESDGESTKTVKASVLTPKVKDYKLDLSEDLSALKIYAADSYYYMDSEVDYKKYEAAVKETSEGFNLLYQPSSTFATNYFGVDYTGDKTIDTGKLSAEVVKSVSGLEGQVNNNTDYDLSGVMVFTYGNVALLGDIAKGESVEITKDNTSKFSYGDDIYSFNYPETFTQSDITEIENVYYMAFYDYMSMDIEGAYGDNCAYVIGFVDDWDVDYFKDNKIKEENRAVVIKRQSIELAEYPGASLTRLYNFAAYSPDWDTTDRSLYQTEVEAQIDFNQYEEDQVLALIKVEEATDSYRFTKDTNVFIFNYKNNAYEEIFKGSLEFKAEDFNDYLSDNGMISIKFKCKEAYTDYAPEIYLVGGDK